MGADSIHIGKQEVLIAIIMSARKDATAIHIGEQDCNKC
jgi:hypothetical protein